jgi:serine/threonine protein kinase
MHIQLFATYDQYAAHKSLCEDLRILHRDISLSNLLLTRRTSSTEHAVGLLIDFDYALQLPLNGDTSDETVIATGDPSLNDPSLNDPNIFSAHASAESSGVLISSPKVTASASATAESSGGVIPSLTSSTSAAGGSQAASIPVTGKGVAGNLRTVGLILFRWVIVTNINPITREHRPSCLLRALSQRIQISLRKPVMTSSHFCISSSISVPSRTDQVWSFRDKFLQLQCANGSPITMIHRILVSSRQDTCSVLTYQSFLFLPVTGKT